MTVDDFSLNTLENNNSEIRRSNSYLFWDNGSKDETFKIQDYEIEADTIHGNSPYSQNKYVFFRTVFDLDNVSGFSLEVKVKYSIDNKADTIDRKLLIEKKHRLTWNEFRVH